MWLPLGSPWRGLTEHECLLCWLNACATRPMGTIPKGRASEVFPTLRSQAGRVLHAAQPVYTFAGCEGQVRDGSISLVSLEKHLTQRPSLRRIILLFVFLLLLFNFVFCFLLNKPNCAEKGWKG